MHMENAKKKSRKIGFDLMIRITDWLVGNKARIDRDKLCCTEVTEMLTKEFGKDISESTCRMAAEARGIKFTPKPRSDLGHTIGIRKFRAMDVTMIETISQLFKGLGEPEPAQFRELHAEMTAFKERVIAEEAEVKP